ncbi:hypothetical protein PENSPDRAFT_668532 [Peniophora sp. CONT]|nr:hypothetical protein PENSPDRAFT_668532 [Peniophora sp. CONT]
MYLVIKYVLSVRIRPARESIAQVHLQKGLQWTIETFRKFGSRRIHREDDIRSNDELELEANWYPEPRIPGTGEPWAEVKIHFPVDPSSEMLPHHGMNWIAREIICKYQRLRSHIVMHVRSIVPTFSRAFAWACAPFQIFVISWPSTTPTKRERRAPSDIFLSSTSITRFVHVWDHTSRHMALSDDPTLLQALLLSAWDFLGSSRRDANDRSAALEHLAHDDSLALGLYNAQMYSVEKDMCVSSLKMVCLLMRECYVTRTDLWQAQRRPADDTHDSFIIRDYLRALFSLPVPFYEAVSPIAGKDAAFDLPASICHFNLRWFLLLKVKAAYQPIPGHHEANSSFNLSELKALYFSEYSQSPVDRWHLLFDHRMLEHPGALLLLLNSPLYNPVKSLGLFPPCSDEDGNMSSCLLPLHDNACCRRIDGPLEHIAACTVLTILAQLLRAPEGERDKLLQDHLRGYGRLWGDGLPLIKWEATFELRTEDRRSAPSDEFLAVLHDAGLGEWLKPGGDATYFPPLDTPLGLFLSTTVEEDMWPKITFADVLRTLTEHVDMTNLRSGLPESFQWLLHTPGTLISAGSDEEEQDRLVYHGNNGAYSHESAEAAITRSPRRGGSFDWEQVVIDNAVGIVSSQPSRPGEIDGRTGVYMSVRADDDVGHGHGNDIAILPKQSADVEMGGPNNALLGEPGASGADDRTSKQGQEAERESSEHEREDGGGSLGGMSKGKGKAKEV